MNFLKKLNSIPRSIWLIIILYVIISFSICFFQYIYFIYDGYDLAIFDQVVWNTLHGDFFAYSFNPYSYLVDHRTWLLLLFVPIYAFIAHPLVLLFFQSVAIALGVIPLFLITKKILKNEVKKNVERIAIIVSIFYLIHPSVQAMNYFEFHVLPFAFPLIFWLWLLFLEKRFRMFFMSFGLLLLLRDDASLMTAGFGVLIFLLNRRFWKIALAVLSVSVCWFFSMLSLGKYLSPDKTSKFFTFYQWIGATPGQAIINTIESPLRTISVLLDYDHAVVLIFLFAAVGFLPLFKLRYLLPTAGPLLVYFMINQQMLSPVLKSHYASLIVPWFFIAAIYGYAEVLKKIKNKEKKEGTKKTELKLIISIAIPVVILAHSLVIGYVWTVIHSFDLVKYRDLDSYRSVIAKIDVKDSVMATERLYTYLSRRKQLYAPLHLFTGKLHFSNTDYTIPQGVDWLLLEHESILRYGINLPFLDRQAAWQRFEMLLKENNLSLTKVTEDILVFSHLENNEQELKLIETTEEPLVNSRQENINNDLMLHDWKYIKKEQAAGNLVLTLSKMNKRPLNKDDQHINIIWYDENNNVLKEKMFALGFGFDPSHAWNFDEIKQITLPLQNPDNTETITFSVAPLDKQFGPFFTVWSADPILEEEKTVTFSITDISKY